MSSLWLLRLLSVLRRVLGLWTGVCLSMINFISRALNRKKSQSLEAQLREACPHVIIDKAEGGGYAGSIKVEWYSAYKLKIGERNLYTCGICGDQATSEVVTFERKRWHTQVNLLIKRTKLTGTIRDKISAERAETS